MPICSKCNTQINKESKFCPQCGNPVDLDNNTTKKNDKLVPCKKCKQEVSLGIKECPYCKEKYPTATLKATIMTFGTIFIILWVIFSLFDNNQQNERKITKAEYGDKWAFTHDEAVLKCYKDGDIKSPVIEINSIPYGLTGFAEHKYGQSDINALNKYLLKDTRPYMEGLHIDIGIFTDDALKLCK